MPVILAREKLMQGYCKFKDSLGYIVRPYLKVKTTKTPNPPVYPISIHKKSLLALLVSPS
jgi:hypothetical protein